MHICNARHINVRLEKLWIQYSSRVSDCQPLGCCPPIRVKVVPPKKCHSVTPWCQADVAGHSGSRSTGKAACFFRITSMWTFDASTGISEYWSRETPQSSYKFGNRGLIVCQLCYGQFWGKRYGKTLANQRVERYFEQFTLLLVWAINGRYYGLDGLQ